MKEFPHLHPVTTQPAALRREVVKLEDMTLKVFLLGFDCAKRGMSRAEAESFYLKRILQQGAHRG